jgi:hypothetical protein
MRYRTVYNFGFWVAMHDTHAVRIPEYCTFNKIAAWRLESLLGCSEVNFLAAGDIRPRNVLVRTRSGGTTNGVGL